MSNYQGWAFNPDTSAYEHCFYYDDCFGPHRYGVRFSTGPMVHREEETEKAEEKWLEREVADMSACLQRHQNEFDKVVGTIEEWHMREGPRWRAYCYEGCSRKVLLGLAETRRDALRLLYNQIARMFIEYKGKAEEGDELMELDTPAVCPWEAPHVPA